MSETAALPKFSLNQWIKHPTTILLIIVTGVAWGLLYKYVDDKLKDVNYLKDRIAVLEQREQLRISQDAEYMRTILFKDAQIKKQATVIDSLKNGG